MEAILGLLGVFLLVFINGFFVAGEFALVGARRTRIAQLAAEGHKSAQLATQALGHLDNYIAATQLGITLASLGLGWIGEPAVAKLVEPIFELLLPERWISAVGHTLSVGIAFTLVTVLHIVLGELAPKSIALQRAEGTALVVIRPTTWFLTLFHPIIRVMNYIGNTIIRMLGFEPADGHAQVHSAEELEMLITSSHEAGFLQESEERLLRRVFNFSDIQVQEVMQPRVEVDSIPHNIPVPQLLALVKTQHHSRYPVYKEKIDNLIGVLHLKDLLDTLIDQPTILADGNASFDIEKIVREPLFVPETLTLDQLLEQMQRTQNHLAVVVDEYGGVAGVATMEDIFEQLVGEVEDEFDAHDQTDAALNDDNNVEGLTSLNDIIGRFGDIPEDSQSMTIGGYIGEQLARIPRVGDTVRYNEYDVRVLEMEGRRVSKVHFSPRNQLPANPPEAS